jgi:tetratricopeptide (TPR) repeat protein
MKTSTRWCCLAGILIAAASLGACGSAQSRKAGYIERGQKYYASGNYDKARLEFRNAVQIDSKDADARFMLGQVAEKSGDVRDALGQYQAALNANPKQAGARAALGRIYLYGGLPDKAVELAEVGLATDPKNAQFLTVRGAARAQLGNAQAALEDAQIAVQISPSDDYAIALLASLYKRRGEFDQAIHVVNVGLQRLPNDVELRLMLADLQAAHNQPSEAEVQLRAVVALEPNVISHRYLLAQFYLRQQNVDAAEKTLREAVASVPDSNDAKLRLVEFLASQRSPDRAAAQVDQFLANAPDNDKLRLDLGQFLAQQGQTERAESAFRAVIAHAGTAADGLSARDRLASLLVSRKDIPGAAALIAEVLKQNPRDNDALILRSTIALARGETQAAINDMRAVLRDQPNAVPVMRMLSRAYQQNNEPDLAEETLRTAVQISPKDFQSRLDLAQTLMSAGKMDQAGALLEQLVRENPSSLPVQESLYRVQAASKRYSEALATAQTIEHTYPKMALGYYLTGLIDETEQKPDAAAKDYEQALQRESDAGEPLAALVRLDLRRKQSQAAMARVNAVITHSPDNAVARNLKAEMLMAAGQVDTAASAYQDTVQVAPNWPIGYHGLALAQMTAKHNDAAIKTLQLGIDKTQAAAAILIEDLSGLYERLGRPQDAIDLYERLLAKNPNSFFAANNLAMLLVTYHDDAASLARAQKLADQLAASSEVNLIDTRGWVKFKSGDFHGAESLLQQAVDKAPTAPEIRYHLGMAQLRSGEQQSAEQNLESAVGSNRPFPGMDDAKAALAQLKKVASLG